MCKSGVFVNCDSKPGAVHSATPAPVNKTRTLAEGRGRRVPGGKRAHPPGTREARERPQKMLYSMYNKLQERSFRETLGDLVERGLVVLPSRSIRKDELAVMVEVSGKPGLGHHLRDRRPRDFHHHGQLIRPDAAARQHDEPSLHQIPQRFTKRSLLHRLFHDAGHGPPPICDHDLLTGLHPGQKTAQAILSFLDSGLKHDCLPLPPLLATWLLWQ